MSPAKCIEAAATRKSKRIPRAGLDQESPLQVSAVAISGSAFRGHVETANDLPRECSTFARDRRLYAAILERAAVSTALLIVSRFGFHNSTSEVTTSPTIHTARNSHEARKACVAVMPG